MSDILCRVCGEPWDAYGVWHGDMTWREALLFRRGCGCPCCNGERPEGVDSEAVELDRLRGLVMDGPEDPDDYIYAPGGKWDESSIPDVVLFQCPRCEAKLVLDDTASLASVKNEQTTFEEACTPAWKERERMSGPSYSWDKRGCDRRDGSPEEPVDGPDGVLCCPACVETCAECH